MGTVIKIGYAFVFQQQFGYIPGTETKPALYIGGHSIPVVNFIADILTGFEQTDHDVNNSKNLYPGQKHCKYDQGHSIWHEQSANGIVDIMYLCDFVNSLVVKYIQ